MSNKIVKREQGRLIQRMYEEFTHEQVLALLIMRNTELLIEQNKIFKRIARGIEKAGRLL